MPLPDKNNDKAVNEFNQYVKPVSLWADAWKRLRRNKMAVLGMWIVGIYMVITFTAPILPFHSYTDQEMLHINLPPSTRPAGVVALGRLEERRVDLVAAITRTNRDDLKQDLERIKAEIIQLKAEMDTNPIHKRVYILGTDYLGREIGRASCRERV